MTNSSSDIRETDDGDGAREAEHRERDAGADHIVDLAANDLRNSLRDQVFAVTDGRGADVVIDPLGDDIFDEVVIRVEVFPTGSEQWCAKVDW